MTRLFIKIFLWFWATVWGTGIILVTLVVFHDSQVRPKDHDGLIATVRYFGTVTASISKEHGQIAATDYLDDLSRDLRFRACLFDTSGHSLAGDRCDTFDPLVRGVQSGASSEFSIHNRAVRIAVPVTSQDQQRFLFASELPVAPRVMLQVSSASILLRVAYALLVSGPICFALARFLTRPVLNLRSVAQQIASGDLSVRANEQLAKRRDELGYLVHDFNSMADTTQRVISRQRQLLFDISHELRSPLTRMNVAIDLLRGRIGEDAALLRIASDTERLDELIGRLITVTKLENTATLQNPSRLKVSDLVRSVAADTAFEARECGSQIRMLEETHVSLFGDYSLLRSAIENVIRNAVRHTARNTSVDIRVCESEEVRPQHVLITVRDYGNGVPEKELQNIFEPFYRVIDTDRISDDGVGLGLSITDRVIRLHKGTIMAENATTGDGLIVTIRLPLNEQAS